MEEGGHADRRTLQALVGDPTAPTEMSLQNNSH